MFALNFETIRATQFINFLSFVDGRMDGWIDGPHWLCIVGQNGIITVYSNLATKQSETFCAVVLDLGTDHGPGKRLKLY